MSAKLAAGWVVVLIALSLSVPASPSALGELIDATGTPEISVATDAAGGPRAIGEPVPLARESHRGRSAALAVRAEAPRHIPLDERKSGTVRSGITSRHQERSPVLRL
jgi:hypothetical protein